MGCGFGASGIYLAKKYGAKATGITTSPAQVEMARKAAAADGGVKAKFVLMDAEDMKFDQTFDVVWSIESILHYPQKTKVFCFGGAVPGIWRDTGSYGLVQEGAARRTRAQEIHIADREGHARRVGHDAGLRDLREVELYAGHLQRDSEQEPRQDLGLVPGHCQEEGALAGGGGKRFDVCRFSAGLQRHASGFRIGEFRLRTYLSPRDFKADVGGTAGAVTPREGKRGPRFHRRR